LECVDLLSEAVDSSNIVPTTTFLRYPNDSESDNLCLLSLDDINRLRPGQTNPTDMYLSDSTADFCISYMGNNAPSTRKDIFISSSLFYTHLKTLALINDFATAWYIESGSLLEVDNILIPVISDDHCSAVVITNIWGTPIFYHYDSLETYHSTYEIAELVAEFLRELRRPKFCKDQSDVAGTSIVVNKETVKKLKGPVQDNKFDCGIFMLKFIQKIHETTGTLDTFFKSFRDNSWSNDDILIYRNSMYDICTRLYDEFVGNRNMIATQNIVRNIEESRYSSKHKEIKTDDLVENDGIGSATIKLSIDAYILQEFGNMENYIRLVPNSNDQDYI